LTILNDILSTEKIECGFTVILGDININIIGIDKSDNEYLDKLSMFNYKSFINIYTRTPTGFNHSCIDHIFVKNNKEIKNFNAGVIQTNCSDHFSTILSIPVSETINTSKCNAFDYIDFKKVNTSLKSELWAGVYDSQNVNVSCVRFYNIVSSAIDTATTKKIVSSKYK